MDINTIVLNVGELVKGEERIKTFTGRWEYVEVTARETVLVRDRFDHWQSTHNYRTYYHVDCDCIVDNDQCCILCGARSPLYCK